MPELKVSTGMPAATAFLIEGMSASGVTRVVAMPSTLESMAFWISTACLLASGSEEYFRVDAGVLGGLVGAGLDPVPEGVTRRLVGDHGEGVAGVAATTPPPPVDVVLGAPPLLQAAEGEGGGRGHAGCDGQALASPSRSHR